MKIAILMLVHNAPKYVIETISGLKKTKLSKDKSYKIFVVDNASNCWTRFILRILKVFGYIDYLRFNSENQLFSKGNNTASELTDESYTHYLLLNSDIRINSAYWLEELIKIHPANGGISSLGAVKKEPIRADGYCFLINKFLYDKYKLDENFEWWWAATKLQSQVLKEGYEINVLVNHENLIHHYGGKSGQDFKNAKGMNIKTKEVMSWFDSERKVNLIEKSE